MNPKVPLLLGVLAAASLLQGCQKSYGAACTTNADCSGLPVSDSEKALGIVAFCKTGSIDLTGTAGFTYPGGFCTKRCGFSTLSCGLDAQCEAALGVLGEYDNICMPNCRSDSDCRAGYGCIYDGSGGSVCAPVQADGGLFPTVDAGPGRSGQAGVPCVLDTDCRPPGTGFCLSEVLADGGLRGYPGGQCSAECGAHVADPGWCGTRGTCSAVGYPTTDGRGPAVFWSCGVACSGVPDSGTYVGCRDGYICTSTATGDFGQGLCIPDCHTPGFTCPTGASCTTSGLCL